MLKTYFVYVLECSNGSFYTGYTTDIERRYQEHCDRSGKCNYTRSFPPKKIAACWSLKDETASLALQIEREIKKLLRPAKESLIKHPANLITLLKNKGYTAQTLRRASLNKFVLAQPIPSP